MTITSPLPLSTVPSYTQKLENMEKEVKVRGIRSNAERGVFRHEAWPGLMKLLRQTVETTAGASVKHPKLVRDDACTGGWGGCRLLSCVQAKGVSIRVECHAPLCFRNPKNHVLVVVD